jgi:hypothetical protein
VRPGLSDRPEIRQKDSGTGLSTILKHSLSFKTVVTSQNIILFKIKFSRQKMTIRVGVRSSGPRPASWCTHMYRISLCTYVILTCQYHILTCQYHILTCQYLIRTASICSYLHVSARILANGSLLLPPVPICSPALACALASGRYSSLARRRTVAALLLQQFCRAGSARRRRHRRADDNGKGP